MILNLNFIRRGELFYCWFLERGMIVIILFFGVGRCRLDFNPIAFCLLICVNLDRWWNFKSYWIFAIVLCCLFLYFSCITLIPYFWFWTSSFFCWHLPKLVCFGDAILSADGHLKHCLLLFTETALFKWDRKYQAVWAFLLCSCNTLEAGCNLIKCWIFVKKHRTSAK